MELSSIRPLYVVKDLKLTIRYYQQLLGFEVQFENPFFAMMGRDNISLMFKEVSDKV